MTGFEPAASWSQTRRSSQAEPHPAKIAAYYSKPYCTLPLKEIEDTNALLQLASAFYSEADTYRTTVEKIIETVHSHTFAVELTAKLLENGISTPDQLLTRLLVEKDALAKIENISADNARLVSNLHANLGGLYRMKGYPDLAREHMEKIYPVF